MLLALPPGVVLHARARVICLLSLGGSRRDKRIRLLYLESADFCREATTEQEALPLTGSSSLLSAKVVDFQQLGMSNTMAFALWSLPTQQLFSPSLERPNPAEMKKVTKVIPRRDREMRKSSPAGLHALTLPRPIKLQINESDCSRADNRSAKSAPSEHCFWRENSKHVGRQEHLHAATTG
ncbi:Hypothetical predicted protein [Olea europaea subsp. europaea]|uniref:Uncharacterized protein n=1 Tax=Olea europaea subsp. europaea TaxID=158383 RepID=A0A8S0TKF6_OLEEU|nr:Hypothetical predicted protein [Olea europaea subsp. europaea]